MDERQIHVVDRVYGAMMRVRPTDLPGPRPRASNAMHCKTAARRLVDMPQASHNGASLQAARISMLLGVSYLVNGGVDVRRPHLRRLHAGEALATRPDPANPCACSSTRPAP